MAVELASYVLHVRIQGGLLQSEKVLRYLTSLPQRVPSKDDAR